MYDQRLELRIMTIDIGHLLGIGTGDYGHRHAGSLQYVHEIKDSGHKLIGHFLFEGIEIRSNLFLFRLHAAEMT